MLLLYRISCILLHGFLEGIKGNFREVDIVVHVLLQVLRFKAVKSEEIGIITPYDAQKKRIKNEIINQARVYFNSL